MFSLVARHVQHSAMTIVALIVKFPESTWRQLNKKLIIIMM